MGGRKRTEDKQVIYRFRSLRQLSQNRRSDHVFSHAFAPGRLIISHKRHLPKSVKTSASRQHTQFRTLDIQQTNATQNGCLLMLKDVESRSATSSQLQPAMDEPLLGASAIEKPAESRGRPQKESVDSSEEYELNSFEVPQSEFWK